MHTARTFIYGKSVGGDNFTDRIIETRRLKMNNEVDDEAFSDGLEITMNQVSPLFMEQSIGLTTFQLNFLRAICSGYHNNFNSTEVTEHFPLGTRNNLSRIINALTERELIELKKDGTYDISDPMYKTWFKKEMM